ncbi:hypothetical protein CC85DRAFT_287743 [Cutaneotrichosporon oleaginosum]|uniref:Uncharacterized protein n=1 Tax=Cutaneotrichosporon oleaginosum TaxID=879819 RepID=A0A0J0XGR0_9TREE|nr:uncharacterized protein CC85DRAFT_287743 [Cutaneotrichosporon oleaginosum]KLT40217.1 hypothetical protein CC85DRAFT_287743 [Cutaneotrichosporon oleaginosum]TXT10493.1 hypothetical protein COLE_04427 [Cutaneotrichosporon oleaginosum]
MLSRDPRSRPLLVLCAVVAFLLIGPLGIYLHPGSRQSVASYVTDKHAQWFAPPLDIPCDPNEQPGYPHPGDFHWVTENPQCPGDEFYNALRGTPRDQLWWTFPEFRNKSVLLAGDSVGRHLFETLCGDYFQAPIVNEDVPGWKTHYGWTSTCVQHDLGLKIAMIHIYGMANTSDPAVNAVLDKTYIGADWDLQSRVTRWWNTTLKGFTPDFVQLNSGAWDYRYWFIRDMLEGKSHDDLPLADRETNAAMAIQSLNFFRSLWPDARMWYMHMSMMNEDDIRLKIAHGKTFVAKGADVNDTKSYPALYTWRRQSQYRATMRTRIAEAGWDSLDVSGEWRVASGEWRVARWQRQ